MIAAVRDTPPRFLVPIYSRQGVGQGHEPSPPLQGLVSRLSGVNHGLSEVAEALIQAASMANYLNLRHTEPEFCRGGLGSTKLIGPVAHFVLSMPRLVYPYEDGCASNLFQASTLQEMVRLTLLMLLAVTKKSIFLICDELNPLMENFTALLPLIRRVEMFPELRIWAIAVFGCVSGTEALSLVLAEIRRGMVNLHLEDGEDAISAARAIVWIDVMFEGNPALALIEQMNYNIKNDQPTRCSCLTHHGSNFQCTRLTDLNSWLNQHSLHPTVRAGGSSSIFIALDVVLKFHDSRC